MGKIMQNKKAFVENLFELLTRRLVCVTTF